MHLSPDRILILVLVVALGGMLLSAWASRPRPSDRRPILAPRSRGELFCIWAVVCGVVLGLTTGLWLILSIVLPDPTVPPAVFAVEAILLDLATRRVVFRVPS